MKSYHFSLGNSTDGPVGFCARIYAGSPEEAVATLQSDLPAEMSAKSPYATNQTEYIQVYFNPDAISVDDIDEEDDE